MKDCYLSGHGDTNGTMVESRGKRMGMDQTILQKGIIPVYDQQKCATKLDDEAFYKLSHTQMCAFDAKADKGDQVDACQGDSGGPFVCPLADNYLHPGIKKLNEIFKKDRPNDRARKMVQVGIVSFGVQCGQDMPGVYTKVSMFKKWMTENMMENSPNGVANSIQLIDAKGKVRAAKESRINMKSVAKKVKYCLIRKNYRRKGALVRLISGTKCEISLE